MAFFLAWALLGLGILHIIFGVVRFQDHIKDAWRDGFIGKFNLPEGRRTAFWFIMAGPFLMAIGQIAVHAVANSDFWTFRIIGYYLLVSCGIGVLAFPKSPLWTPLLLSFLFIAVGFKIII